MHANFWSHETTEKYRLEKNKNKERTKCLRWGFLNVLMFRIPRASNTFVSNMQEVDEP